MTTEIKRLIQVRVDKGAAFKRDGYGKKRQLSDSWRKPRGQHNKQREQKKAKGALPKPGFGSPIAVRGMHPSGFFEVLISSVKELEGIDPKTHAVRIGATVGDRTRSGLQEKALGAGFKVLNARSASIKETKPKKIDAKRFSADQKKKDEKASSKSKIPAAKVKKETKKVKDTPKAEEKKAPAKTVKTPAKSKSEKAEKTSEKAGTKTPAKTDKKSVKPKAENPTKSAEAKPKATPKPKTTKKTKSGVKKNE
ncbi:MAG TPA: 50S ribosomal protein L32e [Methanoregula sp.]|nr:50S ribosomal protein L32e [Methanoregula sp.]